ncbi:GNAT family N-acetyltransferase [Pendulispora rubella]|uniref:GNAT family N-acetyltransferase n=1 Tax=Pendulispora rubella TaxID=2741070 RepID=A0ABZ2L363_9BACT
MDEESAVLAWLPLASAHMSLIDQVRCGIWTLPASWSWGPLLAMGKHEEQAVDLVCASAPRDAAYLYIVGVAPEAAGRGLGKAIIVRALRDMAPQFRTCMLKTDQPRNVPMYRHLGFHVVAHEIVPSSGSPVWIMRQDLSTAT